MLYQYSHRLGAYAPGLDPDAKAYIAAVETALSSSISGDQKNAINDFFKTGKSDGWYSSIKRIYLPIWADAAANAIDMVTRTSGTFTLTGVDHGNVGYVQGNGIIGKFTSDASPQSVGMSATSGGACVLLLTAPSGAGFASNAGTSSSTTNCIQMYHNGNVVDANVAGTIANARHSGTRATNVGIYLSSRISATDLKLHLRKLSGFSTPGSSATSVAGNSVPSTAMVFMAQDSIIYSDAQFGAFVMHLGLTTSQATNFTLALKNLWETASGLTLP